MSYDEFFTDGDKPYSENLNDSLLLLDAFDVTVPCELPTMYNNTEFSSTTNVARKAGTAIVTLKSVGSGVTIGTNSISGTGEVVFRVYPNFNAFYKWYSLIVTKSAGTVSVAFKKTDGTSISATIGNNGVISEASALKTLQEIDVVLTLTSATISKILINFVNNQNSRTRTSALLEADQLTNVNGSITSGNTKAVNGGAVYSALQGKSNTGQTHSTSDINGLINLIYPVGCIYMSVNDVNPSTLFGGTWERIKDRFLLCKGDSYTSIGGTGGSATHTLSQDEMPSHTHTQEPHAHAPYFGQRFMEANGNIKLNTYSRKMPAQEAGGWNYVYGDGDVSVIDEFDYTANATAINNNTGGGQAHNNMPPYLVVNVWKRTA